MMKCRQNNKKNIGNNKNINQFMVMAIDFWIIRKMIIGNLIRGLEIKSTHQLGNQVKG